MILNFLASAKPEAKATPQAEAKHEAKVETKAKIKDCMWLHVKHLDQLARCSKQKIIEHEPNLKPHELDVESKPKAKAKIKDCYSG